MRAAEAERVGVDLLSTDLAERLPDESEGLQDSLGRLAQSLAAAQEYVDDVVAGRRQGSVEIGRQLAEAVAAVPHLTPEHFERVLQDQQNDVVRRGGGLCVGGGRGGRAGGHACARSILP